MNPQSKPNRRPQRTRGPFFREDGSRYWLCRIDARHRIEIPREIVQERGWLEGDTLRWELLSECPGPALRLTHPDALDWMSRDAGAP